MQLIQEIVSMILIVQGFVVEIRILMFVMSVFLQVQIQEIV
jgi:hypothetical protein